MNTPADRTRNRTSNKTHALYYRCWDSQRTRKRLERLRIMIRCGCGMHVRARGRQHTRSRPIPVTAATGAHAYIHGSYGPSRSIRRLVREVSEGSTRLGLGVVIGWPGDLTAPGSNESLLHGPAWLECVEPNLHRRVPLR